ncbi:SDR family NAD(P)-dependent oxidoreductase [Salinicoccus albus]|uniref:SDR family NAD(P)-dependent oxidoreductase n=1 Tax=Salinicoccus albus TaxID=418756 RepID=UPI00036EDCD9|nr:glucose 1-dehydrogenase [Salinicoccus albus]
MKELQNKITIITGSGSGIGRETALLFAEKGAIVVVNDVDETKGEETVDMIHNHGNEAYFIQADVTDAISTEKMVSAVIEKYGKIDVLFNNAGISNVGPLHNIEEHDWDNIVDVNIKGVFLTSKYVLPHMMKRQVGSIINMSSCVAEMGLSERTAYAATKGAVLSMTKSMQVDYAPDNIKVNALLPGTIYTPFVEGYLSKSSDPDAAINKVKQRQLSGELGKPEDVANAALFLASDQSKFIMGSPLYIDGGVVFGKNA